MNNIGVDIGKKQCVVCVMDVDGNILEETSYPNTRWRGTHESETDP